MNTEKSSYSLFNPGTMVMLSLLMLACTSSEEEKKKLNSSNKFDRLPNVVFILADDLGYHDLGIYGQPLIQTPHIDRLATEGVRFTNFYAGSPVCAPSRSVLLTGQHTGHTKVRANYARQGQHPVPEYATNIHRMGLEEDDTTIGNVMQQAGYRTGLMGKWHLSGYEKENLPIHRGFDEYRGSDNASRESRKQDMELNGDEVVEIAEELRSDYSDDIKTANAVNFIKKNKDQPFFLMLSLSAPHKPFEIPSQGIYKDKPWNEMSKNYAAMITRLDQHVGMIRQTLQQEGLSENTVIIFGSDNGGEYRPFDGNKDDWKGDEEAYPVYEPQEWAEWTQLFKSTHPLKGGKGDMYEGGIRVPVIIHWPGQIEEGSVNTNPWYFADFMPTIAAIGGRTGIEGTDGINMIPVLKKEAEYPENRYLYWEFYHEGFAQALRWKDWKMIRWSTYRKRMYGEPQINDRRRSQKFPHLELYNLEKDISEENNVVEEYPQVREKMLELLDEARTETPYWPLTEEEKEGLRNSSVPQM